MKNIFKILTLVIVVAFTALTVASCDDDDDEWIGPCPPPNSTATEAIVTCRTNPTTGQFYMQLNDSVALFPINIKEAPFGGKEVRARIFFQYSDSASAHYGRSANVMILDSIRTKPMAPVATDMDKTYGNDPVEIVNSWETVCEDGYLTLRFRTYFGFADVVHSLNLVRTGDNTVELRHNANGDVKGTVGDGIIAFRLDKMPDTKGEYKDLTLKWMSFSGEKSLKFKYKTRE